MPGILPPGTRLACVPHVDSFDVPIASNSSLRTASRQARRIAIPERRQAPCLGSLGGPGRRRLKLRATPPPAPCSAPYSAAVFIPAIVSLAAAIALTMLW